ncbi:MAG: hypothetical protein AAF899_11465 [Pseudomonadota bacterium]
MATTIDVALPERSPIDGPRRTGGAETTTQAQNMRLAMAIAIVSVAAHKAQDTFANAELERWALVAATLLIAGSALLVSLERTSRLGVGVFGAAILFYVSQKWMGYHNHGWLAVWTIPVAFLFGSRWWAEETFRWYLRMTLGVVMLGACAQKLLAGTYLDGSFITYLSLLGSNTEQMFGFLCADLEAGPCLAHKALGTFLMAWQAVVGILLIAGFRHLWFLIVEVAFLLGAGLYADEMNFQVLNIALFCMAFGYGMPVRLAALCMPLLVLDVINISEIIGYVL